MLQISFAHRTEDLLEVLAEALARPKADPLEQDIVMVQSQGMARWLNLQLAQRHGIVANLYTPFPRAFMEQVLTAAACLGGVAAQEAPPVWRKGGLRAAKPWLDRSTLTWRLYRLLPELGEATPVRRFIEGEAGAVDALKLYQMSVRLAACLDNYLLFRHKGLIQTWEDGRLADPADPAEAWQALIYRRLLQELESGTERRLGERSLPHAIRQFLQTAPEALRRALDDLRLPQEIVLFGINQLPPLHLAFFERLAELRSVRLLAFNPCREYWSQLPRSERRALLPGGEQEILLNHPLLSAWGRLGADFLHNCLEAEAIDIDFCAGPERDEAQGLTNLQRLQQDIYTSATEAQRYTPALHSFNPQIKGDDSLVIHSCRSPLREAEVVRDFLLRRFSLDPDLDPADILILCPDLEAYAPILQAVFARPDPLPLPLSVADQGGGQGDALAQTFLKLLRLGSSRFGVEELFLILEHPSVAARFQLDDAALDFLRSRAAVAGIHWGADAQDHKRHCGVDFSQFSWSQGLDQLVAGYAAGQGLLAIPAGAASEPGWQQAIDICGQEAAAWLEGLLAFHASCRHFAEILRTPQSPAMWRELLRELLEAFFVPAPESAQEDEAALSRLRLACAALLLSMEESTLDQAIPAEVLHAALQEGLEVEETLSGFMRGGITVCKLLPMRSIPARVICIMGLNEGVYPRMDHPAGFDLMRGQRLRGDRSSTLDDRYLFLETLMAAREHLCLSFQGHDQHKDEERLSATVLTELLELLCRAEGARRQDFLFKHSLHAFSPRVFASCGTFSVTAAKAACCLSANLQASEAPFLPAAALPPKDDWQERGLSLDCATLAKAFTEFAPFFCRQRLGLIPPRASLVELSDDERFKGADGLYRHALKVSALPLLLHSPPAGRHTCVPAAAAAAVPAKLRALHPDLPITPAGAEEVNEAIALSTALATKLEAQPVPLLSQVWELKHEAAGLPLCLRAVLPEAPEWQAWTLSTTRTRGNVRWLKLWARLPEALAFCAAAAAGMPMRCYRLASPDDLWSLSLPADVAAEQLRQLLDLCASFLQDPPFLMESALAAALDRAASNQAITREQLALTWKDEYAHGQSDADEPCNQILYGQDNPWDKAQDAAIAKIGELAATMQSLLSAFVQVSPPEAAP